MHVHGHIWSKLDHTWGLKLIIAILSVFHRIVRYPGALLCMCRWIPMVIKYLERIRLVELNCIWDQFTCQNSGNDKDKKSKCIDLLYLISQGHNLYKLKYILPGNYHYSNIFNEKTQDKLFKAFNRKSGIGNQVHDKLHENLFLLHAHFTETIREFVKMWRWKTYLLNHVVHVGIVSMRHFQYAPAAYVTVNKANIL